MGFDSKYRREVIERWKQTSARTKLLLLEALATKEGVSLKQRLRCALEVLKSHGKNPPEDDEELLDDHDGAARIVSDPMAHATEENGGHSAQSSAADHY